MRSERTENCINWIRDWFAFTGGKKAVVGISGGKDSTVVAALCKEALGPKNVIGVLMPNGTQKDIEDSLRVVEFLGIESKMVNIEIPFDSICGALDGSLSEQSKINLAPRLRMAVLYAVAQGCEGRVACTGNACERFVGYTTIYGDLAGDFAPIADFTVSQVVETGLELKLPKDLVLKTPADGLSGKSDEEKMGFLYSDVEKIMENMATKEVEKSQASKIMKRHFENAFKSDLIQIPKFEEF